MDMSIVQWNARSLLANGQEFKHFIEEQVTKPTVICIQETWLKPSLDFALYGYVVVRRDRDATGGGVATCIQQGLNYRVVETMLDVEAVLVEVWMNNTKVRIVNFYNPCLAIVREVLEELCEAGRGALIFCGDFNAHNTLWGGARTDDNGNVVEDFLDDFGLVCLNDGGNTRFDVAHGTESAIDLTIVSNQLAGVCTWKVIDCALGSDHYVIMTTLRNQNVCLEENWFPRWKLRQANWGLYSATASAKLLRLPPVLTDNVNELNTTVTDILCSSAEEVIGKSSGRRVRKMVPWWSDDCKEAVRSRNKAFKVLKSSHTFNNMMEYKRAQSKVKRIVRDTKHSVIR